MGKTSSDKSGACAAEWPEELCSTAAPSPALTAELHADPLACGRSSAGSWEPQDFESFALTDGAACEDYAELLASAQKAAEAAAAAAAATASALGCAEEAKWKSSYCLEPDLPPGLVPEEATAMDIGQEQMAYFSEVMGCRAEDLFSEELLAASRWGEHGSGCHPSYAVAAAAAAGDDASCCCYPSYGDTAVAVGGLVNPVQELDEGGMAPSLPGHAATGEWAWRMAPRPGYDLSVPLVVRPGMAPDGFASLEAACGLNGVDSLLDEEGFVKLDDIKKCELQRPTMTTL